MFYVSDTNGILRPLDDVLLAETPAVIASEVPLPDAPVAGAAQLTAPGAVPDDAVAEAAPQAVTPEPAPPEDAVVVDVHPPLLDPAMAVGLSSALSVAAKVTAYQPTLDGQHVDLVREELNLAPSIRVEAVGAEARSRRFLPRELMNQTPPPDRHGHTAIEIMSAPVITLFEEMDLGAAWDLFRVRRFRHIPILSKDGKLVGMLSDRDLFRVGARDDLSEERLAEWLAKPIREQMTTNVLTVRPGTATKAIGAAMIEYRVGAMPVMDERGELIGIITRTDLLRAAL